MNITKIVANPKETLIGLVKRATNCSSLSGQVVQAHYDGIPALVYPHEDGSKVITYLNEERLFRAYPSLRNFKK